MEHRLMKLNAYGRRWHVLRIGFGIIYSGKTAWQCRDYARRHGLTLERAT